MNFRKLILRLGYHNGVKDVQSPRQSSLSMFNIVHSDTFENNNRRAGEPQAATSVTASTDNAAWLESPLDCRLLHKWLYSLLSSNRHILYICWNLPLHLKMWDNICVYTSTHDSVCGCESIVRHIPGNKRYWMNKRQRIKITRTICSFWWKWCLLFSWQRDIFGHHSAKIWCERSSAAHRSEDQIEQRRHRTGTQTLQVSK